MTDNLIVFKARERGLNLITGRLEVISLDIADLKLVTERLEV